MPLLVTIEPTPNEDGTTVCDLRNLNRPAPTNLKGTGTSDNGGVLPKEVTIVDGPAPLVGATGVSKVNNTDADNPVLTIVTPGDAIVGITISVIPKISDKSLHVSAKDDGLPAPVGLDNDHDKGGDAGTCTDLRLP